MMSKHLSLITWITCLLFAVNLANGQEPTLACISSFGVESPPPCKVDEDSVLNIKVTVAAGDSSPYAVQGLYTTDLDFPTHPSLGTARAGSDYTPLNYPISGADTASMPLDYMIQIFIPDDKEIEPTEEFLIDVILILDDGTSAMCTSCNFIVQIIDNDGDNLPVVTLEEPYFTVEEGKALSVRLSRGDDGGVSPIIVGVLVKEMSATFEDFSFEVNPTVVSLSNGETEVITIQTYSDKDDDEGIELFEISIVEDDDYTKGMHYKATVSITDPKMDDPEYSIEFSNYQADENKTPFTFNIIRSKTGSDATIMYSTRDVSTTAGLDYQAVTNAVASFSAHVLMAQGTVDIILDKSTEDPEIFEITIANPSDGILGQIRKAIVTLYDSTTTQSIFFLDRFLYLAHESSGGFDVTVKRSGDVSKEGSVVLASADDDAMAYIDYQAINLRITFEGNEDEKTTSMVIENDKLVEATEYFELALSQPSGGVVGNPGKATVSIQDNDYCFAFTSEYYSGTESNTLSLGVSKKGNLEDDLTSVGFTTTDGTAIENIDYTRIATNFDFERGKGTKEFEAFTLSLDDEFEIQEQFTVTLRATDPNNICEPSTATVAIEGSAFLCPCQNGGTCVTLETGGYNCLCDEGFEGTQCEEETAPAKALSDEGIAGVILGAVGLVTILGTIGAIAWLVIRRARAAVPKANEVGLPQFEQQGGGLGGLNPAMLMDGGQITYPYYGY